MKIITTFLFALMVMPCIACATVEPDREQPGMFCIVKVKEVSPGVEEVTVVSRVIKRNGKLYKGTKIKKNPDGKTFFDKNDAVEIDEHGREVKPKGKSEWGNTSFK